MVVSLTVHAAVSHKGLSTSTERNVSMLLVLPYSLVNLSIFVQKLLTFFQIHLLLLRKYHFYICLMLCLLTALSQRTLPVYTVSGTKNSPHSSLLEWTWAWEFFPKTNSCWIIAKHNYSYSQKSVHPSWHERATFGRQPRVSLFIMEQCVHSCCNFPLMECVGNQPPTTGKQ